MTALPKPTRSIAAIKPRPTIFDILAYFQPSAHFKYSRRIRKEFDDLAKEYAKSTWLLGKYGGKARMQTDIEGIGVATRVEIGRLSLRSDNRESLIQSAFELFRECDARQLVSGGIKRILINFQRADEREIDRQAISAAFHRVFLEDSCCFLNRDSNSLELGQAVEYQTLTQYLREDGLYHSAYRTRVDALYRHLSEDVGRYENHQFYIRPTAIEGDIPLIDFCYTGDASERIVEAYVEGYTDEKLIYIDPQEFNKNKSDFVYLKDYERASRRYGGLWILQEDIIRYLMRQQLSILYLFFNGSGWPAMDIDFSWDDLFQRQRSSIHIDRATRNSPTYLDMMLEGLVRSKFLTEAEGIYQLAAGFKEFKHVSFYDLGEYSKGK
jgi:hypothetical protein